MSIGTEVCELVEKNLGLAANSVTLIDHLHDDLGMDSLDIIDLVVGLEEHFDIQDLDSSSWSVIKDVVDSVEGLL